MVKGIDTFRQHFMMFDTAFVVIGGTASALLLDEAGLEFRSTKDVDMILIVEALSPEFVDTFWHFVEKGGYENIQHTTGKPLLYRFWKPKNERFPEMVELFSRKPDAIGLREESHLTPVPVAEEVASLSAILMNDSYYALARTGVKSIDGLPVLGAEYLIPFKAKAWLDLSIRRKAGEQVDDKDIRKHRNDVFRLYQIISPEDRVNLPHDIADDMKFFLNAMEDNGPDTSHLGIKSFTLADALRGLREVYRLETGS